MEQGLIGLRRTIDEYGIKSIAIPALGCGLGGLNWDVQPLILQALAGCGVDLELYQPNHCPLAISDALKLCKTAGQRPF